ncbi:hypothetical protein MLD38_029151 [Melastoma candidum]|uniref:Uncharacterized protein n=1 Tax=Melastoma candidum TaxID=119954 RepID=A0ACB9N4R9_9MYRT|nr:hypothetical protein MLD38_029151 [Melastoma candidum]
MVSFRFPGLVGVYPLVQIHSSVLHSFPTPHFILPAKGEEKTTQCRRIAGAPPTPEKSLAVAVELPESEMMAMIFESAIAYRFPAGSKFCSSSSVPSYCSLWTSEEPAGVHVRGRWSGCLNVPRGYQKFGGGGFVATRRSKTVRKKVRVTAEHVESVPDPAKCNRQSGYHLFEDVAELAPARDDDACLTLAETARTIVEVNSTATLLFSGLVNEEVHESVFWPDLPYVNDRHGNIYFRVTAEENVFQNIASADNAVQLIIGLDASGLIPEMELSGPADVDFGIEEIVDDDEGDEDEDEDEDEDGSEDVDYDQDWVSVLEDEDEGSESDENPGDWATLETVCSAHPMDFAKKLAEVASDEPVDWMEGPPVGVCIQGALRPVLLEENSMIEKLFSNNSANGTKDIDELMDYKMKVAGSVNVDEEISAGDIGKGNDPKYGTSYYTLLLAKIELISVHGGPVSVEVEDFLKAKPDAIAHFSDDIVSHLKADGEKTVQALKALCWRCKGVQVEEAQIVHVDSLGFDVRVCSATQLQTFRFGFDTRATSRSCAERKLNNLLFPESQPKPLMTKRIRRSDS